MGRTPKPDPQASKPTYPLPEPADYSDEVSDADLDALKNVVGQDDDEMDLVDGPAWWGVQANILSGSDNATAPA